MTNKIVELNESEISLTNGAAASAAAAAAAVLALLIAAYELGKSDSNTCHV